MLAGMISKLYTIQGINTIKAMIIGKSIVQENDINWSNLIRGKEALVQINIKIITHDLIPIVKPDIIPSSKGVLNISVTSYTIVYCVSIEFVKPNKNRNNSKDGFISKIVQ